MDLNEVDAHLQEIAEMYGSESYFHRLKKLTIGLKQPRSSRAYKEAMIEIQRFVSSPGRNSDARSCRGSAGCSVKRQYQQGQDYRDTDH